ncbi:hypothetical protein BRW65_29705 [Mycobacterium paraffinicum]|uniref:HTH lysR-type domain-containing protein n=1 Tax=Mycobacterium paraffinicum TaxID=53378 RepID=A0A1Q4H7Q7_9MYCO|nr:hypothetical protein BRW65_29705 [Mycobacterium paraffinicum]
MGEVLAALNLPVTRRPSWLVRPSPAQLDTIATVTGLHPDAVLAMTLSRYDGTGLEIDHPNGRIATSFPFGYRPWSRYCPHCLAHTGGRWQLHWRLGWSFACVRHHCLLADECPRCGKHPRPTFMPGYSVPSASLCACGCNLADAATLRLRPRHPVTDAQQQILDVIADDSADFGIYSTNAGARQARSALNDVKVLANRALNYASVHGIAAVKSADLPADSRQECLALTERPPRRATLHARAPLRALDTAVGVTAALDILRAPTLNAAADRARWLIEGQNRETGPAELHSCPREGTVSAAIIIKASAAWMGPINQLRYRTALSTPRPPDPDPVRVQRLAASVPAAFWPAWSTRFIVEAMKAINLRPILSGATLLTGTTAHLTEISNHLGAITSAQALNCYLFALSHSPGWPTISTAVMRLNDFLAEQPAPINYTRRRQLDYSALLPLDRWQRICQTAGDLPGAGRKAIAARYYLIEKISGTPARSGVIDDHRAHPHNLWKQARNFARTMSAQLREHLDEEARQFLQHNAIEEPLTWAPPLDLISDLDLPAPDPAAIDRQELLRLAVDNSYTVGQLAEHFGIDQLAVRYLFDEEPIDRNDYSVQSKPGKAAFAAWLRAELDSQTLHDLYVVERLTLRQIAERYGIGIHHVHKLSTLYGIPMRRHVHPPSAEWLCEQRFLNRRSVADIASEIGVSRVTTAAWISQRGSKASVVQSNRQSAMDTGKAIELLKPALTDKCGGPWLQMLSKAAAFPSLAAAERDLGLGTGTLRRRLAKLETMLGAPLIARNRAGLAMAPTPFGVEVVQAVRALNGTVTMPGTSPPGVAPRLTVHVAPVPGEALDSWLETTAHRCRTSLADLLGAVGLTQGSKSPRWIVVMNPEELRSVSKATGITQRQLRMMTLQCYDGVAVDIDRGRRVLARTRCWGFGAGSRYCPACLAETQGRWKIEWRLVWSFACLRHECLLADTCPSCGNYPRLASHKPDAVPQPGRCASPPRGHPIGGKRRCLADLTDTKGLKLPPGHPVLDAQRHIDRLLTGASAARPSTEWTPSLTLDEVATHARRAIKNPLLLSDVVPPDLLAVATPHQGADLHTNSRSQLSRLFKPSAADVAVGTLLALTVLDPGRR